MYGLVNRAVEGLVRSRFGDAAWITICERAEIDPSGFVAMDVYDDAVTYRLVDAASKTLELAPETVLEAFGEYWTIYTIEEGYGDLVAMMGSTLNDFLDNLDSMHERIGYAMPELVPPSFKREALEDGSSILHYYSEREGLAPMVIGLIKGLAKRFNESIEIELLDGGTSGHKQFRLRKSTSGS
ncbi:MAG: heme NO-binding domain-containing protein [Planctomycetota bacterium]|nr:heme NO-binding domain-containing protein [Planctomycetota bacterium]